MASSRDVVVETDRLLAAAEASCRDRFRPDEDPDSSEARASFRRAALRVTLRVAAASAFALAGVAAVSVGANGALAALGGGLTTPRTLPSTAPRGRWGSAFDAGAALTGGAVPVPEAPRHAARDPSRPVYRLRDGKAGVWTAARDVPTPTPRRRRDRSQPASATPATSASKPLRAAPVLDLDPAAKFPKWDREPYEYEMPKVDRRAVARARTPRTPRTPASRRPAGWARRRRTPPSPCPVVAAKPGLISSPRDSANPNPRNAERLSPRSANTKATVLCPGIRSLRLPRRGRPPDLRWRRRTRRTRRGSPVRGFVRRRGARPATGPTTARSASKRRNPPWIGTRWPRTAPKPKPPPSAPSERLDPSSTISTRFSRNRRRKTARVASPNRSRFAGRTTRKGPPRRPRPCFEESSYEAAMTDGDRFAAKTSYHAWNEEDPVRGAAARRRRDAQETERLRAIIHGDRARAKALANLGEVAMENSYEGDGSVPWDWSPPAMVPETENENEEEDRGALGATTGLTLDEYEAEIEAYRASTPAARAEREAKETARRERSRRNADGSISWNAPPAPSAPPRRASGIADNDAVRAASTEDAAVSWDDPNYDPRPKRVEPEPEPTFEYEPPPTMEAKKAKASDESAKLAGEKPRVNPDGSVPWDVYGPEDDRWKPSDAERAAYEDSLERADETEDEALVEEEEEGEEEETSYTIGEGEGGAVAWNAAPKEETVSAPAEKKRVPAKPAMNTRDYEGVEAVDDPFIRDPEEAAEYEAQLFNAALGDSLVESDPAEGVEAEPVVDPVDVEADADADADADEPPEEASLGADAGALGLNAERALARIQKRQATRMRVLHRGRERVRNTKYEPDPFVPEPHGNPSADATCMISALGGPFKDEPLCQKYKGDPKACQTQTFTEQSCWHKTIGARFLDPKSMTEVGPRKGRGPPTRRDDNQKNAAWVQEYYDCMAGHEKYAGSVEAPYRLPQPTTARQVKKHFSAKKNEAYMYVFLHVPKAGGTYFKSLLHQSAEARIARLGGQDPHWDPDIVQNWNTGPLVDMTENAFANVNWHIVHQHPPQQFGGEGMRQSYAAGHRAIGKGALSLGVCEYVDAPCAYFTVLRDPFERYMSHYAYLCLEGSEDYTAWDPSWKRKYAATGCPESPVEFFHRVGSSTTIFAPGANPTTSCAVEAAKRNLRSGCMRYLLLDKLSHGLQMMRNRLPDFNDMGLVDPTKTAEHKNGSGDRLTRRLQARLDSYLADEKEMAELKGAPQARDGCVRIRQGALLRPVGQRFAHVLSAPSGGESVEVDYSMTIVTRRTANVSRLFVSRRANVLHIQRIRDGIRRRVDRTVRSLAPASTGASLRSFAASPPSTAAASFTPRWRRPRERPRAPPRSSRPGWCAHPPGTSRRPSATRRCSTPCPRRRARRRTRTPLRRRPTRPSPGTRSTRRRGNTSSRSCR